MEAEGYQKVIPQMLTQSAYVYPYHGCNLAIHQVYRRQKHSLVIRCALLSALILVIGTEKVGASCTDFATPAVQWLRCYMDGRYLANVQLIQANVRETSFQRSDMSGADLSQANAYRSKMISTKLVGATLDQAAFIEADFTRADLTRASLRNTDLRRARFYHAILRESDLTGARLDGADLLAADFSGATWIDGQRICDAHSIGQCN